MKNTLSTIGTAPISVKFSLLPGIRALLLIVICSLVSIVCFSGCDILNGKTDKDLLDTIDEEVRIANAPKINVKVENVETGVTQGAPSVIKLGVTFNLKFTPFPNYGFIGWTARMNGLLLSEDEVSFSNPGSMETAVTVNMNPGNDTLWIVPLGEGANSTDDFYVYPEPIVDFASSAYNMVPQEHYIKIRFSKALAPESLRFASSYLEGTYLDSFTSYGLYNSGPQGVFSARFNNIAITGAVNPPVGARGFYLENFYYPPLLSADGKSVYLWSRTDRSNRRPFFQHYDDQARLWYRYPMTITVNVAGTIKDSSGLSMGSSKSFSFMMVQHAKPAGTLPPPPHPDHAPGDLPPYTATLGYGSGNIFPNCFSENLCVISEDKARGTVGPGDLMLTGSSPPFERFQTPAAGGQTVYLVFQATNTRWRVVGSRITTGAAANVFDDVPLLGENLPGETYVAAAAQDILLREKLSAAYFEKMRSGGLTTYSEELPVYVVRYTLPPGTGMKTLCVFARVAVEPFSFPAGTSGSYNVNVNRVNYGTGPIYSSGWLFVNYE